MDIKITPAKIAGQIEAPASKSAAHRMLICAALADKPCTLKINETSQDILATAECLTALGAKIDIDGELFKITPVKELCPQATLDCGESGSTLRFMIPVAAALGVNTTFTGRGRLPERPVSPLTDVISEHGVKVEKGFPVRISGKLVSGKYTIAGNISSQFVTGLILALALCEGESCIEVLPPVESKPYIDITVDVVRKFGVEVKEGNNFYYIKGTGYKASDFRVEGDWSNSAFWFCSGVAVNGVEKNSKQGDKAILSVLEKMGSKISEKNGAIIADVKSLQGTVIDASDIPDLVPVIAVTAATASGQTHIINCARLRLKESDRIETTVELVNSLGGKAKSVGDSIIIDGVEMLEGGTVNSFNDHRIAMAAAVGAIKCKNSVTIVDAGAVKKSYPDFYNKYISLGGKADVL